MSIDIEELRKLAEAATPGPWISHPKGYYGAVCASENEFDLVAVTHGQRRNNVLANEAYIAAANPATVIGLIAEIERLRDDVSSMTGEADALERQLNEARNNDITAMGYLADCRIASGDNGKRMLPEFVEYLREMKRQRDELLTAVIAVVDAWSSQFERNGHLAPSWCKQARTAIANAEKTNENRH